MPKLTHRAFHLPADERALPSTLTEPLQSLLQRCSIDMPEIVRTGYLNDHRCVMVMDDEAIRKGFPVNRRAQYLSGYPLEHALRGDALFFGETMTDGGLDLVNISQASLDRYLQNPAVAQGYSAWLFSNPVMDFSSTHGLGMEGRGLLNIQELRAATPVITGPIPTTTVAWDKKDLNPDTPMERDDCPGHPSLGDLTEYCDGSCGNSD